MSVTKKVVERRDHIAEVLVKQYEYGDDVQVISVEPFSKVQGTEYTSGVYKTVITLKDSEGEETQVNFEIIYASDSDEVLEAFCIEVDSGMMVGEAIIQNPDLITHMMNEYRNCA